MPSLLTIDIGNTAMKVALRRDGHQELLRVGACSPALAAQVLSERGVDGVAVCCVGRADMMREWVGGLGMPVVWLDPDTPVPVSVRYDRRTLGADRLAAAVGVAEEGVDTLIVDAGTALTADLVEGLCFAGGNISPGVGLRLRSLNAYTSRLPLVDASGDTPLFGHDTVTAIRAGVVRGVCAEIMADYESAKTTHKQLKLVLTGGDAPVIAPILTACGLDCQSDPEAVGRGLERIFNHNVRL